MSREIDLLAREFKTEPITVIRTEINLYQSQIQSATNAFLKKVESECKRQKKIQFTLVALIKD